MLKEISLARLKARPDSPTRMSLQVAKKLRRNMEAVGRYEAIVVRPRLNADGADSGDYEILDGHARVDALRSMGAERARCEVWTLDDRRTRLFLAARDGVKGETVPELRLDLLLTLLERHAAAELADVVSETEPYLRQLLRLRDSVDREARHGGPNPSASAAQGSPTPPASRDADADVDQPDRIPLTVMLTRTQYAAIDHTLRDYMAAHGLDDIGSALEHLLTATTTAVI